MSKSTPATVGAHSAASKPPSHRSTLRFIAVVVAGCIAAVAALLLGVGLLLPNHWHVKREVLISAPPSIILPLIEDFRQWELWAKHPQDDPTLQYTYVGAPSGVGAKRVYQGQYAGRGHSEIVRSDPSYGVAMTSAVGTENANAHSRLEFQHRGGTTAVTWTDQGEIASVFGVFLRANVEDELGKYMETSLARLKAEAERRASSVDN